MIMDDLDPFQNQMLKNLQQSQLTPIAIALTLVLLFGIQLSAVEGEITEVSQISMFPEELRESSGLAAYDGFLWTINDSGAAAVIHKLDASGALVKSIELPDIENTDWESLASDSTYLYIADTGNNVNRRSVLTIYRVAWDELESLAPKIDRIEFRYGDYQDGNMFSHNFDSEALTVRSEELWLFTKNRSDRKTNLYRFPKVPGSYAPQPSQTFEVNSLVTAADIHPETGELALLGNRRGDYDLVWLAPTTIDGVDWDKAQSWIIGPIDQWEAILWDVGGERLLLSHESNNRGSAGLGEFPK